MKTLLQFGSKEQLLVRLKALTPFAHRRWGKMSLEGMLCHLNDSYVGVLGLDSAGTKCQVRWTAHYLMRPIALRLPLQWPHGVQTMPEVDQEVGGTPPTFFEVDRQSVMQSLDRFATAELHGKVHPIFGALSQWEWMRWGWLHADHHLRQFGS